MKEIVQFGIWKIDEDGITGKVNNLYDYNIQNNRLWETQDYKGHCLWDWLIHITTKGWITTENINDLNIAFLFAQDYFKRFAPDEIKASTAQTLFVQKQIMEIRNQMKVSIDREAVGKNEEFIKYLDLMSKIKYLDLDGSLL